jgi:chemotaxis protein MotB
MMKRINKRSDDSHVDRWLVSYADFITLMFAFFVVMYSISSVNEAKYKLFSDSIRFALALPSTPTSPIIARGPSPVPLSGTVPQNIFLNKVLVDKRTAELGEQQRKIEERMKKLENGLDRVMASMIKQNNVRISRTTRGVVVDISASTLFDTGEAVLHAGSLGVLRSVADVLSKEDMPIEVEGHTDDIPIATAKFPSNWELSSVRASSVVRTLIENGVPERRLSVVGLASNQPLVPNDSAESRARNRRVTITIASPNLDRK